MDVVRSLEATVREQVQAYAGPAIRATSYFLVNETEHIYAVIDVPDQPRPFRPPVVLIARIVDDFVVIEEDLNDQPLWETLVDAGVQREKIVLVYVGESLPVSNTED